MVTYLGRWISIEQSSCYDSAVISEAISFTVLGAKFLLIAKWMINATFLVGHWESGHRQFKSR